MGEFLCLGGKRRGGERERKRHGVGGRWGEEEREERVGGGGMDKNVDPFNGIKDMRLDSFGVFIRMKEGFYASGWWGKQAYCCIAAFSFFVGG